MSISLSTFLQLPQVKNHNTVHRAPQSGARPSEGTGGGTMVGLEEASGGADCAFSRQTVKNNVAEHRRVITHEFI